MLGTDELNGNWGTLLSTGAGGALFGACFPPTDEDEADVGRSYRSGTTTDFCAGSAPAFSKLATGADDWPLIGSPAGDEAPLIGTAWPAKSLSLSRATVDEFVGHVERSLMVNPLRLMPSLSSFS